MEEAYRKLKESWTQGERDPEQARQLMYYAWMHWSDPPFVTGMAEDKDAIAIWRHVYDSFGGEGSSDAEFLYVTSIMAIITPWVLGDEEMWIARSKRMSGRAAELRPVGFTSEDFEGRGEYGRYFGHQASTKDR